MMAFNMFRFLSSASAVFMAGVLMAGVAVAGSVSPKTFKVPMAFSKLALLKAPEVDVPPVLDGMTFDSCWRNISAVTLRLGSEENPLPVEVKACVAGGVMYLLVRYQAGKDARLHRPWHWDAKRKIYVSGDEREETLYVALRSLKGGKTDVWAWRAGRTDPAGFAEDMSIVNGGLVVDSGRGCWYSEYLGGFAGDMVPRFMNREPSGSVADVRARGHWDKGRLTIEFARKLDTGWKDDIVLGRVLLVSVAREPGR